MGSLQRKKIAYLGAGTWGTALSSLLAENGHDVVAWDIDIDLVHRLQKKHKHPKLEKFKIPQNVRYVETMEEAVLGADLIVESVTSKGIRPVFKSLLSIRKDLCPIVITSKGIEKTTGLLFPEVVEEEIGKDKHYLISCLSGPSHAEEVIKHLPTSVVCAAYDKDVMNRVGQVFNSPYFRVYPNRDIIGVSFGGAMKNPIAIGCGISDGLGFGDNTKAAIVTRGLHEIRKLALAKGAQEQTLNGLSGLGDLFVTCASTLSRNYRFGRLIAEGLSLDEAKAKIGMVVEGMYSCISALELARRYDVALPITEGIYHILYEGLNPKDAVSFLLKRAIKEEHL